MAAPAYDAAFEGAGTSAGVLVWRIVSLKLETVEERFYGKFFQGDSYIVLSTKEKRGGGFDYAIHFWIGSASSSDEQGIAAYKTVELDQMLGDQPVQYREVEGHESAQFMSIFKGTGVQYMPGGAASGFNHVVPEEFPTRLLHVKGRRVVRVTEVEVSSDSMNSGDVFILDKGMELFLWCGEKANRYEMGKGAQFVQALRSERGAKPSVVLMSDEPENDGFWSVVGKGSIAEGKADDDEESKGSSGTPQLFQFSVEDGELTTNEIPAEPFLAAGFRAEHDAEEGKICYVNKSTGEKTFDRPAADGPGRLRRSMLNEDDAYILDCGANVFVWQGAKSSVEERKEASSAASKFVKDSGRPDWTNIQIQRQGFESTLFKSQFYQWNPPRSLDFSKPADPESKSDSKDSEEFKIDFEAVAASGAPSEAPVDDGSGTVKVWAVNGTDFVEYPEEKYGQFFAGDSYVIHYQYVNPRGREANIIYFWLGRDSETLEQGSAAARTVELSKTLKGDTTQVRIVQGKEPQHFVHVFGKPIIVFAGGRNGEYPSTGAARLFHVKGTSSTASKAVELETARASSLNSGDCFVMINAEGAVTQWNGKYAPEHESETAAAVAATLAEGADVTVVAEGEEGDDFWECIGGKAEYASESPVAGVPADPRMFIVSDATGSLRIEPVFNFAQDDLQDDDVAIVDTYTQVFVWVGRNASDTEKDGATDVAKKYVEACKDGRDEDTTIVRIDSGKEPLMFTSNFIGWDDTANESFVDPYEAKLAALRAAKAAKEAEEESKEEAKEEVAAAPAPAPAPVSDGSTYTLEELQGFTADSGPAIDYAAKENYLSDSDFAKIFEMSREEFSGMPKWKRQQKKKSAGIF